MGFFDEAPWPVRIVTGCLAGVLVIMSGVLAALWIGIAAKSIEYGGTLAVMGVGAVIAGCLIIIALAAALVFNE